MAIRPSPVVALNRAIAVAQRDGPGGTYRIFRNEFVSVSHRATIGDSRKRARIKELVENLPRLAIDPVLVIRTLIIGYVRGNIHTE